MIDKLLHKWKFVPEGVKILIFIAIGLFLFPPIVYLMAIWMRYWGI